MSSHLNARQMIEDNDGDHYSVSHVRGIFVLHIQIITTYTLL